MRVLLTVVAYYSYTRGEFTYRGTSYTYIRPLTPTEGLLDLKRGVPYLQRGFYA